MTQSPRGDDRSLRDELATFGFSDTEIDTYLTILSQGETTTGEVAEDADVTQRAVYGIAERLEDRGLVRVNDHASPTTIRAVPPAEAIQTLSERLESIQPTLEAQYNETAPKAPEIQIVKSRETVLKRFRKAVSDARDEVILAVPKGTYPEIEAELAAAKERGALVLVLIGEMEAPDGDGERYAATADIVRYWSESLPFLYAVDNESAMIGDAEILSGTHADEDAVVVSEDNLAGSIFGLYLGAYWPASTELHVTDPDPLPREFDWFRTAVVQAILHYRQGTDLRAVIETESGEEIAGRVTEIRQPLVDPPTNEFTLETSIYVETDDGEVLSAGGHGSFLEDYEAVSVALRDAS